MTAGIDISALTSAMMVPAVSSSLQEMKWMKDTRTLPLVRPFKLFNVEMVKQWEQPRDAEHRQPNQSEKPLRVCDWEWVILVSGPTFVDDFEGGVECGREEAHCIPIPYHK